MWFYNNANETTLYPITDQNSTLRTSTDQELQTILQAAMNQPNLKHICLTYVAKRRKKI